MTHRGGYRSLRLVLAAVIALAALSLGGGPLASPAFAADAVVGSGAAISCTPAALQNAVNLVQSTASGTVTFNCGSAPHTIVVTGTLQITSVVTFDGGALGHTTLSGGDARRVFSVSGSGVLSLVDMVVSHGRVADGLGGCIFMSTGNLTLLRTTLHSCQSGPAIGNAGSYPAHGEGTLSGGGAIYNGNGFAVVVDSQVLSSTAAMGGGILSSGFLTVGDSRVAGNRAADSGGGVEATGTLNIDTSLFEHNSAAKGGGLYLHAGTLVSFDQSRVYSNTAVSGGGGVYTQAPLTITASLIEQNQAGSLGGGGLYIDAGAAHLSDVVVSANRADWWGGGLYSNTPLALANTQFLSNTGRLDGGGAIVFSPLTAASSLFQNNRCTLNNCSGGGLYVAGPSTLVDTQFISNSATSEGGGARVEGAVTLSGGLFQNNQCTASGCSGGGLGADNELTLTDTQFLSNTSLDEAGGALAGGSASLLGGLFQGNQCTAALCSGGGLSTRAGLMLTGTEFIANSATKFGGGLYAGGAARVVNALFARNLAAGGGAGIYLDGVGNSAILHGTIVGPAPVDTAAIQAGNGTLGVTNTVITSYTIGLQQGSSSIFEDYNLFFNVPTATSGGVNSGGHSLTGNPRFADPTHNNYHLRANSAAIDAGVSAGIFTDVDGDPRPVDGGFDIGYDEFWLRLIFLPIARR